jgi:hypothetical protein
LVLCHWFPYGAHQHLNLLKFSEAILSSAARRCRSGRKQSNQARAMVSSVPPHRWSWWPDQSLIKAYLILPP